MELLMQLKVKNSRNLLSACFALRGRNIDKTADQTKPGIRNAAVNRTAVPLLTSISLPPATPGQATTRGPYSPQRCRHPRSAWFRFGAFCYSCCVGRTQGYSDQPLEPHGTH